MFTVLADIDWLAYAIAVVIAALLAGLWYAVLVVRPYASSLGREGAPAPTGGSLVTNLGPLVCTAVVILTTAVLVEALDISSTGDAVAFGLVVGVGYLSAMTFQIAINPNVPRPLLYGLVNAPYFVVSSVACSVVLVTMR